MNPVDFIIPFTGGCAFTFLAIGVAVWLVDKVDGWWGHREYRKLEHYKEQPNLKDAVSDAKVGFRS